MQEQSEKLGVPLKNMNRNLKMARKFDLKNWKDIYENKQKD